MLGMSEPLPALRLCVCVVVGGKMAGGRCVCVCSVLCQKWMTCGGGVRGARDAAWPAPHKNAGDRELLCCRTRAARARALNGSAAAALRRVHAHAHAPTAAGSVVRRASRLANTDQSLGGDSPWILISGPSFGILGTVMDTAGSGRITVGNCGRVCARGRIRGQRQQRARAAQRQQGVERACRGRPQCGDTHAQLQRGQAAAARRPPRTHTHTHPPTHTHTHALSRARHGAASAPAGRRTPYFRPLTAIFGGATGADFAKLMATAGLGRMTVGMTASPTKLMSLRSAPPPDSRWRPARRTRVRAAASGRHEPMSTAHFQGVCVCVCACATPRPGTQPRTHNTKRAPTAGSAAERPLPHLSCSGTGRGRAWAPRHHSRCSWRSQWGSRRLRRHGGCVCVFDCLLGLCA
jgi:hypothetical protein